MPRASGAGRSDENVESRGGISPPRAPRHVREPLDSYGSRCSAVAEEARALWSALADRFAACKLVLHPQKTKIVYCKDANRRGDFPSQSFDFLGFSFRARRTLWQGDIHTHGFLPAARPKALTSISRAIRRWALHPPVRGPCGGLVAGNRRRRPDRFRGAVSRFVYSLPYREKRCRRAVEAAPSAQIGLLHGVLGFVQRAKHAVAMHFDFAAERFSEPFKRLACPRRNLRLM
jgi:hypothetical protein